MSRFDALLRDFFYAPDEDASGLFDLAPVAENAPESAQEPSEELLTFRLDGEACAFRLHWVREIVRVPALTEIPRSSAPLVGMINLRGELLPVYDTRTRRRPGGRAAPRPLSRTGTLEAPKSARLVIVRALQGDAAILVDKVDEVIRLPFSALESPPPGWGDRDGVSALARKGDALWAVLDVEQVVS